MSLCYALLGPSTHIFHHSESNQILMIVGLFGIGALAPLAFIPVLPEAIDQVALHWKWAEGEDPETDERIMQFCQLTREELDALKEFVETENA